MAFQVESRHLDGLVVLVPQVYGDHRGFFMEAYRADQFQDLGLPTGFVQDNHSRSARGVLRGMHFQWDPQIGKLMRVTRGAAFLAAVDIRKGSPTVGQWFGCEVSEDNRKLLWAPFGFATGFCAVSEVCEVQYKCTGIYNPKAESGILYSDPGIGIKWPIQDVTLSEKDGRAQTLAQWLASPLSENIRWSGTASAKGA